MELVWYACYGSNIDSGRFLKYLQGGELEVNGKIKKYEACKADSAPPRKEELYIIKRRLYFGEKSKTTWDGHGVGFISNKPDSRSVTYAKLYLISKLQFKHLFEQENAGNTRNINYQEIQHNKYQEFQTGFYNKIIQLEDDYKNYPILTFTNKVNLLGNKPMPEYIKLITEGIEATHKLSEDVISLYIRRAMK